VGAIVVASRRQEEKDGGKGNGEILEMYHSIKVFTSSFQAIHHDKRRNVDAKLTLCGQSFTAMSPK
jgi:hypothetical protein